MKYHLVRITKDQVLRYEQYLTLLHRIEAILNSRLLCYKSEDPSSVLLTSVHFLIGNRLTALSVIDDDSFPLSKKFAGLKRLVQLFWSTYGHETICAN